jgi:hypothetical protein
MHPELLLLFFFSTRKPMMRGTTAVTMGAMHLMDIV